MTPPTSTSTPTTAEPATPDAGDYTLLYDHDCPFCRLEVEWLLRRRGDRLRAVDIADDGFDASAFGLTQHDVESQLHGIRGDGTHTVGMESVRASYTAAGVGWMMAWTGWPVLRWFADLGYRVFARYRVPVGRLFGRSCDDGACRIDGAAPRSGPSGDA